MLEEGPVTNHHRDVLLDFISVPEDALQSAQYTPLTLALAAVSFKQRYLLAYHKLRLNWEIPGGHIKHGETPLQAAGRELMEETGQPAPRLRFEGIMRLLLHSNHGRVYGAVYTGDLEYLRPFSENSEISRISLWDMVEEIGPVNAIDRALLKLIFKATPPGCMAEQPAGEDGSHVLEILPPDGLLPAAKLKFVQVLARYGSHYLLVYNNRRGNWEFPSGGVEEGENWRQCAERETLEESGQALRDPRLEFFARGHFPRRRVTALGAVVTARLTEIRPFNATPEIGGIHLLPPEAAIGCLDNYNRSILKLVLGQA